ncbi:MAG: hypothetical protein P8Y25_14350 [Chromatiaceae bacterium]
MGPSVTQPLAQLRLVRLTRHTLAFVKNAARRPLTARGDRRGSPYPKLLGAVEMFEHMRKWSLLF